jgi:hypothetical protein
VRSNRQERWWIALAARATVEQRTSRSSAQAQPAGPASSVQNASLNGLGSGGTVVAMDHGISAPRDADAMSLASDDAHFERWRSEFMVLRPDVYGVQLRQTMFDELSAELSRSVR